MKTIQIAIIALMVSVATHAQTVTFLSPEFEEGVRKHLALEEDASILQSQTDTITVLDLSGLGISDLSDVSCLPNIEVLNLSSNHLADLSPLLPLAKLHTLNLCNNKLTDINVLAFTSSDQMTVNVSANYIEDFSFFYRPIDCQFTFVGLDLQLKKEEEYFRVYQLYATYDGNNKTEVVCRGYSNMSGIVNLLCGDTNTPVEMDGETYKMSVKPKAKRAQRAILSNGEKSDTTWVIPTTVNPAQPNETKTIETGLPDNYRIKDAYARYGTVNVNEKNLVYTAPDRKVPDVISFSYYQGAKFRGYGRLLAGLQYGDANGDGSVTVTDIAMVVNKILSLPLSSDYVEEGADANYDGSVTVTDIGVIVDAILGNDGSANARRMTPDGELEPQ